MSTLRQLQEKQAELDKFIYESNNITDIASLYDKKIIALDIELSEFMNEVRSFKYWKKNKEINRNKVIEEACDCLHFILSLANDKELILKRNNVSKLLKDINDIDFAYMCIKDILWRNICFEIQCASSNLEAMLELLIYIIKQLDFTYEDLIKEYDRKYEINIQRQVEGY